MGCTIGNSTLALVDEYPQAAVYGVEPGAPILRYAHARAEHLGRKVHFSQQNAEHTDFADGTFDLVVSFVMLHETSAKALPNIFRECHRLLSPGGVMAHLEVPVRYKDMDFCDQVMRDWQTYYDDEPFWGPSAAETAVPLSYGSTGTRLALLTAAVARGYHVGSITPRRFAGDQPRRAVSAGFRQVDARLCDGNAYAGKPHRL